MLEGIYDNNYYSNIMCKHNGIVYRSTWERDFHIVNSHLLYEHTVIQYTLIDGSHHTYLTDFTDIINNIIYEIKPDVFMLKDKNIMKKNIAIQWCHDHDYTYKHIGDKVIYDIKKSL